MRDSRHVASIALLLAAFSAQPGISQKLNESSSASHVLLISIDGMHALDYQNCVAGGFCPHLAALGGTGVTYTRTSAAKPSDSFPGLMNIVTGGTPKTHGAFYDVAYDRVLAPPKNDTGNGLAGGTCTVGVPNGTTTEYEEGVDIDQSQLNGGGPYSLTDGGIKSIDPNRLPRDPFHNCAPVYPWNFVRSNTIYGVIHAAGGYTAWSDKHPVYASVSGPGNNAGNVDDYYSPEVNSTVIALPDVTTATGAACAPVRDTTHLGSWTDSFLNIQCYDTLKVKAILNEISGRTHDGSKAAPVPNIFGMNFQAVSVGQKLIENGVKGGYIDAQGTPTTNMRDEIAFVDASIGSMVEALKSQGLLSTTTIIITAKHGQSPVDPHRFRPVPSPTPAGLIASYLPFSESPANPNGIGPTEDDISLLWLSHPGDTQAAVNILESNADAAAIGQIFYGHSLTTMFNAPGLPPADPRTPDIIVQPYTGVIYSGSHKKQAEHGGFAHDDTNVMLLVSNPGLKRRTVTSFVETAQIAPTILQILGLDPSALQAVRKEGTPVLPGMTPGAAGASGGDEEQQ